MLSKSTYIIIPVHNRRDITLRCLAALEELDLLSKYFVVVIDDGSTDSTSQLIEAQYPNVILLKGDGNLWWTGAIKMGMEYAFKQGAEYFIWLNDDCLPEPDALSHLVEYLKSHPNSIAAPSCYSQESGQVVENGFKKRTRLSALKHQVVEVEGIAGYCVAFSRTVVDAIGFPDASRFPHYAGDDMYILKATRNGFSAVLLGNSKVALTGMKTLTHSFSDYVRDRFAEQLSLSLVFYNKKSRYYLPTQFYYYFNKYPEIGVFVFVIKVCAWFFQFTKLKLEKYNLFTNSMA